MTDKLIVVCGYNSDYGAGMVDILASSVFGRIPNMAVAVMMGNIITLLTKVMVGIKTIVYIMMSLVLDMVTAMYQFWWLLCCFSVYGCFYGGYSVQRIWWWL